MNSIPVALFSNRDKAAPVARSLVEAGFTAIVRNESWLRAFWFVSGRAAGVSLEVPAEQFERAEEFLAKLDATGSVLQQAVRCPECRSLRVEYPQFAQHSLMTNLALGVAAEVGLVEKDYYCEQCHYTWPKEGTRAPRARPHLAPYYFIEGIEQTARQPGTSPHSPPAERRQAA